MTSARETVAPTSHRAEPREADEIPTRSGTPAIPTTNPATIPTEDPEVGLAQKGSGEEAVVRRETEI
ncbi:hypothetical protein MRF4_17650 [Methylobacterium radiotolerans]|uniref:Uncharacterized protein n=1 Tax=Methylobacterium oryzae TaxID=334852 RepID=A0ABU7TI67_9HYPH